MISFKYFLKSLQQFVLNLEKSWLYALLTKHNIFFCEKKKITKVWYYTYEASWKSSQELHQVVFTALGIITSYEKKLYRLCSFDMKTQLSKIYTQKYVGIVCIEMCITIQSTTLYYLLTTYL